MRIALDYITFSVIGLSAAFLGPALLEYSRVSSNSEAVYPIRMRMPGFSLVRINSAMVGANSSERVAKVSAVENSDLARVEAADQIRPPIQLPVGSFAASFGKIDPAPAARHGPRSFGSLLAVDYDLGAHIGSSAGMAVQSSKALAGTLDVRKRIRVGKAALAPIDVKVGSGANIYVNVAQLSSMLQTQGKVLKASTSADRDGRTDLDGFVSLDELRNNGFKVRYDATGDALVVESDV